MKRVWALGVASLGLFLALGWYLQPLQPNIVALQFTFRPGDFQAVVEAWGVQGLQRFRAHLVVDGVLLLCYGAFGYLLVRRSVWFSGFAPATQQRVAALMPLAALFDAVENLLHGYLTGSTGEGVAAAPAVYAAACAAASAKWLFLLLFAMLSVMAVWQRRRNA